MSRRAVALLALVATAAVADEARVVSPRPDSVSITIYRDLVALITESRTVDLPAGGVTLEFQGVVDSLIPQSAVITDAGRPIFESNYDYDRLTPDNLLAKSIGKTLTLTRTNPATGRVSQVEATLVVANEQGVVFRTASGHEALRCSGLPEKMSFAEIPGELHAQPMLSVKLAPGAPGKRQMRVSYIAKGFAWSADYVAHLRDRRMNLDGWLTLENLSGASFQDAEVQVVAGRLNLLDADESRGSSPYGDSRWFTTNESIESQRESARLRMREEGAAPADDYQHFTGCYPLGPADYASEDVGRFSDRNLAGALRRVAGVPESEELEEIVVVPGTGQSMAARENLADYQMYRLPARTDLAARQTKQIAFLTKPDVKVDRFYAVKLGGDDPDISELEDGVPPVVKVAWRNVVADGLGEPLPGGIARFFEDGVFVGDARMRDSPVGVPIELGIGRTSDLDLTILNTEQGDLSLDAIEPTAKNLLLALLTHRAYIPLSLRIVNAKPLPVTFELRQGRLEEFADLRVKNASLRPRRKAGDYLWRLTVPANGEALLSYEVGGKVPDLDD